MSAHVHPCAGLLAAGARWLAGTRVRWVEAPSGDQPRVYFANHSSHLDFVVLWAALPPAIRQRTSPVACQEYWKSSALRRYVSTRVFRSVLIPRSHEATLGGRGALTPLLAELDRGRSLVLFPEGTRGTGLDIGPFKAGLYQICRQRPRTEAVPVYLDNLHRVLPKGEFIPVPLVSTVTFGKPLQIEPDEDHRHFLDRARRALRDLKRR